jgi:vacuolar-type H+-ATPase subunit B/Vma2
LQGSDISKSNFGRAHGGGGAYPEEQIFCIMNEKMIFQTLRQATSSDANETINHPYFVYESMQIFSFLLTTMQKSNLIENDNEYLEFIEPFID